VCVRARARARARFITVHTQKLIIYFKFFVMYTHKRTKAHTLHRRYSLQNPPSYTGATANSVTGLSASFDLIWYI